ncbi:MAG: hypothetical protein Q7T91_03700 [Sulfuricurvum sp.]|nr:hypothetical protein [Sulfuricurvum sp.]
MSFGKLFKLETLGFTENTVSRLVSFFEKFGENSIINYEDILQHTRQKNKINELITFLIDKGFIEEISDDAKSYENKEFKILLSREKTAKEKRAEKYLIENDLYNQTKELIIKKLDVMLENDRDGWVVFIDFANYSTEIVGEKKQLKFDVVIETIEGVLKNLIEKYTLAYKGFELSNSSRGDEAEFYFFDEKSCDKFLQDFLKIYKRDIYNKTEEFNTTRKIQNRMKDALYLKIFKAHSKTVDYTEKNNQMPSFKTMEAITLIKKIEKPIKNKNFIEEMKLSNIDMYFYVSDKMEDKLLEVKVDTDNIGPKIMYYKID